MLCDLACIALSSRCPKSYIGGTAISKKRNREQTNHRKHFRIVANFSPKHDIVAGVALAPASCLPTITVGGIPACVLACRQAILFLVIDVSFKINTVCRSYIFCGRLAPSAAS